MSKVKSLLTPKDEKYILADRTVGMFNKRNGRLKDIHKYKYSISSGVEEYRYINNDLRCWNCSSVGYGYVQSVDVDVRNVLHNASRCDGKFFADIPVGEEYIGSDGSKLIFVSDNEKIDTPAGVFENCQLWKTIYTHTTYDVSVYLTWFKENVGIVKQSHSLCGNTESMLLKSYEIVGGRGYIPFVMGNKWGYVCEFDPKYVISESSYEVVYADESSVSVACDEYTERIDYNENLWLDMIQAIRNEYWEKGEKGQRLTDTTKYIERAEALAKSPMEKAHTKLACSLARRLMRTDKRITPDTDITGHWNFFAKNNVNMSNGVVKIDHHQRWSFEWKHTDFGNEGQPLLYNDIYGILQNAANCIWSNEWRAGATPTVEYTLWGSYNIKTKIVCEKSDPITTKAGTFDDCIKLSLDIDGLKDGLAYRAGNKVYYFAKGVGIVRCEHEFADGARTAVYELTSYKGEGDGYMPICDGMERHYDALNLTDGYVGAADYIYVSDENGNMVIFHDRTGIRKIQASVTQYASVQSEIKENELWDEGKHTEGHTQFGINSFNLLVHFIARPSHNAYDAKRSIELHKYNMGLMEMAGNGIVPDGLTGLYAWIALIRSAAHFGNGEKEEGYKYLEIALESFAKWKSFEKGAELSAGNEKIFGGAKIIKGRKYVVFSNGAKEPLEYYYRIDPGMWLPYNAMIEDESWAWLNSVRGEERFKELANKALELRK